MTKEDLKIWKQMFINAEAGYDDLASREDPSMTPALIAIGTVLKNLRPHLWKKRGNKVKTKKAAKKK